MLFTAPARYLATPAGAALLHLGTVRGEDDLEEGRRSYGSARLERAEALVRTSRAESLIVTSYID
ncbi:hypothetical protein ACFZCP_45295 [Streptomyces sp. NPDC007971]|uniref:hypothetical protein n=1 Tax=Streptomyces sp. NPDC007971 TaxID=3364799 RepID=UPI0036F00074